MKIIIYDLEVFKMDFLFGSIIIDGDKETVYQTWDQDEVRQFYQDNKSNSIFVGWNSKYYDDIVLNAVINKENPYLKSKQIINKTSNNKCNLHFYTYDAMNTGFGVQASLKLTELIRGVSIDTTDVPFDLDRKLTEEEKRLTEEYNKSDLYQTLYNFEMCYDRFLLRLDMVNDFNLDPIECLNMTGAQIAGKILHAKYDTSLKYKPVKPKLYDNLILENNQLKMFFLNEDFRIKGKMEHIQIGDADITIGAGGAHSGQKKSYYDKVLYLDVSGYYNLVMINFDYLSRAIPKEGRELYKSMYEQQLELKRIDPDSPKRKQFKTILLTVFGAQGNPGSPMYDEQICTLVPVTGELYIVDLLEKVQHLCSIVQTNTDGVMLSPNSEEDEKEILNILDKWLERTKFVIKPKYVYNLWQRDVNNYIYTDAKGNIECKGEAVKNYVFDDSTYASGDIFNCKEPSIIAKGIVDFLIKGIDPEETVENNKGDLRLFQYACKKGTYKYLTYDVTCTTDGTKTSMEIQSPSRVFASKNPKEIGMVYKHGTVKKGPDSQAKVSNLPPNVFVYNKEILSNEAYESIKDRIDYDYYVNRIYERIEEFVKL